MAGADPTAAFSLEGKRILVTGASSGIGRCIALLCAQLGAVLTVSGRDEERLVSVLKLLNGSGHKMVAGDITTESTLDMLIAGPKYDGFVSCTGNATMAPFRQTSEHYFLKIMGDNFFGPISLAQKLVSSKNLNEKSSIVFITALAARASPRATSAYSASKAALESASRTMALELSPRTRVNCIAPGYVKTKMLDNLAATANPSVDLIPLGPLIPEDVAPAAAWLLSDASQWISRSTLTIDGGLSLSIRM
jgi:NAD(P)-dependent dehydrogenase (short-subunit alcohol dehydrogenase family)